MKNVVFDLDDLAESDDRNCIPQLAELKKRYPALKVTLFAIPFYQNQDQSNFLYTVKKVYGDWIELAIHGWSHDTNFECSHWDYEDAMYYIQRAYSMGCFAKLFKAPGWQISRDTYRALLDLGFAVADHKTSAYTEPGILNKNRRPIELPVYEINHPWMVHGHTWDCEGNGINTIIKDVPWDEDAQFYFISEILEGNL